LVSLGVVFHHTLPNDVIRSALQFVPYFHVHVSPYLSVDVMLGMTKETRVFIFVDI
jgi:hypothetical protein